MNKTLLLLLLSVSVFAQKSFKIASPSDLISIQLSQGADRALKYQVFYKAKEVIAASDLGLTLKKPALELRKFQILGVDSTIVDGTWKPVWGEVKEIRNNYKELTLHLKESGVLMDVIFRVFDDGIGFRYFFPSQDNFKHFIVDNEWSSFTMTGDHNAFWIPGDYDTNEYTYQRTKISEIDALAAAAKEKDIAVTLLMGKMKRQIGTTL